MVLIRSRRELVGPDVSGKDTNLWWEETKADVHKLVWATAQYLIDKHVSRRAANLHHLRVYSNRLAQSLTGSAFTNGVQTGERIKLNATKSGVDAATAQIATNQPGIMHLTTGGSWDQRKRAERLDRYVAGWFNELQLYVAWLGVFLDAAITGTGIMKFTGNPGGKIGMERVLSDELLVDENECRVVMPGQGPRYMFQVRDAPRSTLLANPRLKKFREQIKLAECLQVSRPTYAPVDDAVTLIEAWKIGEFGQPGRHVICMNNATLLDEPWSFKRPPFAFFHWSTPPLGLYGIGAVEEVLPPQIELNYLAQKLQVLMHFATSAIFKEKGSGIERITNEDFAVYTYVGQPPTFLNMNAASAEFYNHIDRLYTRIYELMGVSQMSATGTKPAGLYSGEAIRLYHDVATRRYRHTEQRAAQFFIDCAAQIKDRAREIVKRGFGSARTLAMGDNEVEQLDWSDVAMDEDMYVMRVRPVSIVPSEPAGKVDMIKALAPVAPAMAPYLLGSISGIPDLEAMVKRVNAPQEYAERIVSRILEEGRLEIPSPNADLQELRRIATAESLNAEAHGVPANRQALLRRLIRIVDGLQAAQAMPVPGMGGQLGAAAGPPVPGMPGVPPQALATALGGGGGPNMLPPGATLPGLGAQLPS